MVTTAHGRALGAVLGNPQPDPTGLLGIIRGADILIEYGDLETQIGIQRQPLGVFKRDRGFSRLVATFSHEADAERFLLVEEFPEVVTEWEEAPDRYLWPDGVRVAEAHGGHSVTWSADDGLHEVVTMATHKVGSLCRAVWVRAVPFEELLQRALRR